MSYAYDVTKKVLDEQVPLVTRTQVLVICKEIDEDTPEDETELFIGTAHTLMCSLLDGYGIPASLTQKIELYLAAHFANLSYPTKSREGMGPMSRSFALKVETGLEATRYGQTAIALDSTGELKKFSDGKGTKQIVMRSIGSGIVQLENA